MDNLLYHRSLFLLDVVKQYADKHDTILEIGSGDGRNIDCLRSNGFKHAEGIDKLHGTPIETYPETKFDLIFTMSTLFLIPPENEWVFKKIAKMSKKYIITIEGETTKEALGVYGRDYKEVFERFGFTQIADQTDVFNQYGVMRIFKKL